MNNKKSLRDFGLIWTLIFFVIFILHVKDSGEYSQWSGYVTLTFLTISLLYPKFFSDIYFYQGWIRFGSVLGAINSKIIIFILFFGLFMPFGLVLKLFRKDLLKKKLDKSAKSYFIDRKIQPQDMKNQF